MAEKKEIALVKSPSSTLKNDDIDNKKSNNSRERASSLLKAAMAPSKSSSSSTISSLKGLKSKGFLKQEYGIIIRGIIYVCRNTRK